MIFTNLNKNIRNEWKIAEQSKGCTYKITHIPLAKALEYQTLYHNNAKAKYSYLMVGYERNLIIIFMNLNENNTNE